MKCKRIIGVSLSLVLSLSVLLMTVPSSIFFSLAEPAAFPYGTLLRDFEDNVDAVSDDYQFTKEQSTDNAAFGAHSLKLSSTSEIGWGAARIYMNLGDKLGAEGSDALNMKYLGFHITAPKGNENDVSTGNVLMQDVQLASNKGWFTFAAGSTYYLLADGTSTWEEKQSIGSSVVLPGEFKGYVLLDMADFGADSIGDMLSAEWDTNLSLHFNKAGADYGSVYMDAFFYAKENITIPPVFPYGTLLRNFEDNVDAVSDDYQFTKEQSTDNAAFGSHSLKLSSTSEIGWGAARIYMNLGDKLGAEGSDALNMKYLGFHITAPKGNENDVSTGNVLMQDVQLASNKGWFTFAAGSTYYLLADGTSTWEEKQSVGSSVVLPGEFNGYVLLDLAGFGADNIADMFSAEWDTNLSLHFNKAGADYGSVYMDAFFYAKENIAHPFPYGTLLQDFEEGLDCIEDSYQFTKEQSTDNAAFGSYSLKLSSASEIGWGAARIYMNLGANLGAEGSKTLGMTYFGFHVTGPKGNANDVSTGNVLMQDLQLVNGSDWYSYQAGSPYYMLADGETTWTSAESISTSVVIPGDFSGYIVVATEDFGADSVADMLNPDGNTMFSMHFNKAGADYGSVYLDAFFYSDKPTGGNEPPKPTDPDEDPVCFEADREAMAAINGSGTASKSQTVYTLHTFENGKADLEATFNRTAANQLRAALSRRHTGEGNYSLRLYSADPLNWSTAVPFLTLGRKLGDPESPSSQMTYVGFHIQTTLGTDFRIQDVQIASNNAWYSLSGQGVVYIMEDGADAWQKGDIEGSSIYLKSNWSGFVVLRIADFYTEGKALVPADVFSKQDETHLQMHFNQAGGDAGSLFLDTMFYSTSANFDMDAIQLVDAEGNYVAGRNAVPEQNVLTSKANSEKLLDIDGSRIFAREMTVGAFKELLGVSDGQSLKVLKGTDEAADTDTVAVGMTVQVAAGETAKAAYEIADVRRTPVPVRDFPLTQKITDATSPLTITGTEIDTINETMEELCRFYLNVPYDMTAAAYLDGVRQADDLRLAPGMTIRCFDEAEPTMYMEYSLKVTEENITNGFTLNLKEGTTAKVEGDTVTVPAGTTVEQLLAMLDIGDDEVVLVLGAGDMRADDEEKLETGMFLMLADDLYEEKGRWNIVVDSGAGENVPTGAVLPISVLVLTAASVGALVLSKRKK